MKQVASTDTYAVPVLLLCRNQAENNNQASPL